jgi:hypothetical protein
MVVIPSAKNLDVILSDQSMVVILSDQSMVVILSANNLDVILSGGRRSDRSRRTCGCFSCFERRGFTGCKKTRAPYQGTTSVVP